MDAERVRRLLLDLCVDFGFCLPPIEQERLVAQPHDNVDAFTDAVFVAEGLNPGYANGRLWRQVRDRVAASFAEPAT
jgi:hypothetical protein